MNDPVQSFRRHIDLAASIALLCLFVLIWTLRQNYQMDADVKANRELIIQKTDEQTKITLEYIKRITDQWEKSRQ